MSASDTRKLAFRREGDEYFLAVFLRLKFRIGKIPLAVKAYKGITLKSRTGIFVPRTAHVHFFGIYSI